MSYTIAYQEDAIEETDNTLFIEDVVDNPEKAVADILMNKEIDYKETISTLADLITKAHEAGLAGIE